MVVDVYAPEIMKRYIRLPTARDIWKALSKAFYDEANELQVFCLESEGLLCETEWQNTLGVLWRINRDLL